MHQNISKQRGRAIKTELPFCLPMRLILGFFLSSVKIQTCQDQTFSKKTVTIRQRNKLALYQTQNGGPNL